jgi:hypothetical protein
MFRLRKLLLLTAFLMAISACEQKSITVQPEHISQNELNQALSKELEQALEQELTIQSSQQGLILTGDPALIAKAISIAQQLDKPGNYYLEVRNTPINSISTTAESMRILLHPEHPVMLGHITLAHSPWQELIEDKQRFLQLILDSNLVLTIEIKSQQDQTIGFYSGKHPMQLDQWIIAFDQLGVSQSGLDRNQSRKIMTSRPKKQLWLRLTKASSQSEINLR